MNENIKTFLEENECECVMVKHGTCSKWDIFNE